MDAPDFSETLQVHGQITNEIGRSCPLAFTVTYPKYRPGPLGVHGIVTEPEHNPLEIGLPGWSGHTKVWGQLPTGETLRLEKVMVQGIHGMEIDLWCSGFTYGMETGLQFAEGKYWIEVALPDAGVVDTQVPEEKSWLGKIESARTAEDGIKWASPVGEAVLADFYHYEPPFGRGNRLTRVKETGIYFRGEITNNHEPPKLLEQVEQEIEDPLRILSFISRKILRWFEIRATFVPADKEKYFRSTFLKRRNFKSHDTEAGEPLLLQRQLLHGKFPQLVERLRASPIKDWLLRAMSYSSSSHRDGSLESQLAAAYLALEALSLGLAQNNGSDQILTERDAEEFSVWIKDSVKQFCRERPLDEDVKGQLIANVDTLGRTSFKRRIKALIEQTRIPTEDLWPPATKLSEGLRGMINRRNKFIHEARIESPPWPLVKDRDRVQAIVERGILALLGWDPTQVSPSAYSHGWLAQGD